MLNYNSTKTKQVDDNDTINEETIENIRPDSAEDTNVNKNIK
jgi:hypothetical protein